MGERLSEGILFINGKMINIKEATVDNNVICDSKSLSLLPKSMSGSFASKFSKLKRKRFIRWLERYGYSKKFAKKIVWKYNKKKIPYGKARFLIMFGGGAYS